MDPLRPIDSKANHHLVVEVVECLADTVISVSHLERETTPRRQRIVVGLAALALVVFALTFVQAVSLAAANKRALHNHLDAGKTAHSFRPTRVHAASEVIAGASLLAGLALGLTALAMRRRTPSVFRAETSVNDDSSLSDLVKLSKDEALVLVHPDMALSHTGTEGEHDADALMASGAARVSASGWLTISLPAAGRLTLSHGLRSYYLNWTPRPPGGIVSGRPKLDSRFAAYLGAAAAAALLMVALLESLPIEETSLYGDEFFPSERYIAITNPAFEDAAAEPESGGTGDAGDTQPAEASQAGAAGTSGIENALERPASMAIKHRSDLASMSRSQAMSAAKQSGILGVMADRQLFANDNALGDFASGDALEDWHGSFAGGPVGHQAGELSGSWGNHERGMGQWGIVKVGNRLPGWSGACGEWNCRDGDGMSGLHVSGGGGGGPKGRRIAKTPGPILGNPHASGGLDRAIIRRYIKQQKLRITHCYEKRLLVNGNLAGTLTARFSIAGNGTVIGASATGMGDSVLQECVAGVIGSIQFPSTEEGALVNVSYPFTFQAAGA